MDIKRKHLIGKGKKLSIAKAGLVLYYYLVKNDEYFTENSVFDYGELPYIHDIIDIAGANHVSFLTSVQVIACLRNSPYWDCTCYYRFYSGIGNGRASLCKPSKKGKNYYLKNLYNIDVNLEEKKK